jgi:26S proteasome regulatory subunit N9
MAKPLEFVDQLAIDKPDLADDLSDLSTLYQRKLWHQLTLKLEELYQKPAFNQGDLLVQLYNGFVADFGAKLNLLRLAHLAVSASKRIKDPAAAVAFLKGASDKVAELKLPRSEEPLLYLSMHIAQQQLEQGQVAECKAAIEEGAAALERLPEPDPSVSASVHFVSSLYFKLKKDYAKFYRSSMQVSR